MDHENRIIKANLSTYLSCIGNETELSNEQTQVYSSFTISKNSEIKRNDAFQDLSKKNINSNPNNVNDSVIIKQDQTVIKIGTAKNDTYSNNKKDMVISKKLLKENNCFIKNDESEAILFLKNIKSFHVIPIIRFEILIILKLGL